MAVEQGQRPLSVVVTGQRGDAPQFEAVMAGIRVPRLGPGRPRTRPDRVRADKAYSSRAIRAHLRRRGIGCTIPESIRMVSSPLAPARRTPCGQFVDEAGRSAGGVGTAGALAGVQHLAGVGAGCQ
jgi:hypothetical protein